MLISSLLLNGLMCGVFVAAFAGGRRLGGVLLTLPFFIKLPQTLLNCVELPDEVLVFSF
jgi:hypothetical protein